MRTIMFAFVLCVSLIYQGTPCYSQSATTAASTGTASAAAIDAVHRDAARKMIDGGIAYLLSKRDADGGWSVGPNNAFKPAATALALKALLGEQKYSAQSPEVKQALGVLLGFRQKDGGIYGKDGQSAYTTAVAVMALKAANDPQYNDVIREAVTYLKGLQVLPGQESPDAKPVAVDDPRVGGVGYGKPPAYQPNLSVLGFVMEGWESAGVAADDQAVQKAAEFLTRLQNRSESNPQAVAAKGSNDGGFYYALNESKAGNEDGGLRSYGSMTYVGFKSMLYAGLSKDDPRVQAAYSWIRRYWGLDSNPNMPDKQSQQGLFYYYQVLAKALRAYGQPIIKDAKNQEHNWRQELIDALAKRVQPDGSWKNDADRWEEGSPILVTVYCVTALQEAMK